MKTKIDPYASEEETLALLRKDTRSVGERRLDAFNVGDYIIKGVKGEFYPCKPDVFEMTYEPADPVEQPAQQEEPVAWWIKDPQYEQPYVTDRKQDAEEMMGAAQVRPLVFGDTSPPAQQQQQDSMAEFLADLHSSRTKYPRNRRMFDGLMGEVDELRRAYAGDGDMRAEAFDVAVCAFRIATEGDAGGNTALKPVANTGIDFRGLEHRIATVAAEELIRSEGESTGAPDTFLITQCQVDGHMRDCIAHLVWHGEAACYETEDGHIIVLLLDFTLGGGS